MFALFATVTGSTDTAESFPELGIVGLRRVFPGSSSLDSKGPRSQRRLRRLPQVPELRVERAVEGWSCGAPLDVGRETLVARHDIGVAQDPQHARHDQIARSEAVAVEIG